MIGAPFNPCVDLVSLAPELCHKVAIYGTDDRGGRETVDSERLAKAQPPQHIFGMPVTPQKAFGLVMALVGPDGEALFPDTVVNWFHPLNCEP